MNSMIINEMSVPQASAAMDRFRDHFQRLTGISLPASKVAMIHQRLRRRVAECGFDTTAEYLNHLLQASADPQEMVRAVDLLTTNTTSFFREPQHFDYLVKTVVPEFLAKINRGRFKVWSAASSDGAEAYTTAMVLAECQRQGMAFDCAVLGTDLSTRILAKASQAIYSADQTSGIDGNLRSRYVMHSTDPRHANESRVVPELRRRVRFAQLNLMDQTYPVDADIQVVFLRNVLIYFDAKDQAKVIDNVARHIARGGYLMVGHSESMIVQNPTLRQVLPAVFKKV